MLTQYHQVPTIAVQYTISSPCNAQLSQLNIFSSILFLEYFPHQQTRYILTERNPTDFGLFLFDVLSDVLNGVVFMREGQETWGLAMIGITFLPMTVVYALAVLFFLFDYSSWWSRLAIILIAPILAPLAIPIMTVAYVVFVAYIFARKCVQPDFTPDDHNNGKSARYFKLLEALFEASFQSVIGLSTR